MDLPQKTKPQNIPGVQYLRGLAALGVVLCHYGSNLKDHPKLSQIFNFGQSGVQVFFLISGFIIVYSLIKAKYKSTEFFRFLLKRSIRIDPSYIATIILTIALFKILSFIPSFKGQNLHFIPGQFLAHLFYIVPFTKYPFYNHVFWTLGIEFQFYLLIGITYFLSPNQFFKTAFIILFTATCFINFSNGYYIVFTYAPFFALGISLVSLYQQPKDWVKSILPSLLLVLIAYKFGFAVFLLLSACSIAIILLRLYNRVLFYLGQISYSLYLTHSLMYIVVVGFLKKSNADLQQNQLGWLAIEVLMAIGFAHLFYRLIEKPSLSLSKKIFYKKRSKEILLPLS